jgi:hypothetical protein
MTSQQVTLGVLDDLVQDTSTPDHRWFLPDLLPEDCPVEKHVSSQRLRSARTHTLVSRAPVRLGLFIMRPRVFPDGQCQRGSYCSTCSNTNPTARSRNSREYLFPAMIHILTQRVSLHQTRGGSDRAAGDAGLACGLR